MGPAVESALTLVLLIAAIGAMVYLPFRPQWARLKRSINAWQRRDEERETEEQHCREAAAQELQKWTTHETEQTNLHEKH